MSLLNCLLFPLCHPEEFLAIFISISKVIIADMRALAVNPRSKQLISANQQLLCHPTGPSMHI